jgi:hypothetical protein
MNKESIKIRVTKNQEIDDNIYYVVGGSFQAMLSAVKGAKDRKYITEEKVWHLYMSLQSARNYIEDECGLYITDSLDGLPDEVEKKIKTSSKPKVAKSVQSAQLQVAAKCELLDTSQVLEMFTPNGQSMSGDDVMPEYGITYQEFARMFVDVQLFYQNKVKMPIKVGNYTEYVLAPMNPEEILTHTLSALSMGVGPTFFSKWRGKDGELNTQLDYGVAIEWIRANRGKNAHIHTVEITDEAEKLQYTRDTQDTIYACYVVDENLVPGVLSEIGPLASDLRKEDNKLSISKSRTLAKTILCSEMGTRGIGITTKEEMWQLEWVDKKQVIKTKNGKPVPQKYFSPNGRGWHFKAEKRAIVDAAKKISQINFNLIERSPYKASVRNTELMAHNPALAELPADRKEFYLRESTVTPEQAKGAVNVMRNPEDDGIN